MRRALPLLFLVFVYALMGCGDKPVVHESRPKVYRTVISLSPSTTEIFASNADLATLKGRTSSCNWPMTSLTNVPVVASVKPDYEKIQALRPDMILYDKSLYSEQDIDKLKSTKAQLFEFKADTVDGFIKELYELGSLVGSETRFNDYVIRIQVEIANATANKFSPVPKVAVLLPSPGGADYIDGTDSFLGDVIKIAGGQLVGPKSDIFGPLNAEAFVAMNPDVILVGGTKTDVSSVGLVLNDPRFKTISAVKNNRVRPIDSDVLLRRGQRVDQLIKAINTVLATSIK